MSKVRSLLMTSWPTSTRPNKLGPWGSMPIRTWTWTPKTGSGNRPKWLEMPPLDRGFFSLLSNLGTLTHSGPFLGGVWSNVASNSGLGVAFLDASSGPLSAPGLDAACNLPSEGNANNKKVYKYKALLAEKKRAHFCNKITRLHKAKKNRFVKLAADKPNAKR